MRQEAPKPGEMGFYFGLAEVGLEMVAPLVLGVFLDYQYGWKPWATIGGFVLGMVGGFFHLLVMLQKHEAQNRGKPPGDRQ